MTAFSQHAPNSSAKQLESPKVTLLSVSMTMQMLFLEEQMHQQHSETCIQYVHYIDIRDDDRTTILLTATFSLLLRDRSVPLQWNQTEKLRRMSLIYLNPLELLRIGFISTSSTCHVPMSGGHDALLPDKQCLLFVNIVANTVE